MCLADNSSPFHPYKLETIRYTGVLRVAAHVLLLVMIPHTECSPPLGKSHDGKTSGSYQSAIAANT